MKVAFGRRRMIADAACQSTLRHSTAMAIEEKVQDAPKPDSKWGPTVTPAERREQLKLVYDYVKFHLGLCLGTPAVIGLLGRAFGVDTEPPFQWGLGLMIGVFFISGASAAWFMGVHVNEPWGDHYLDRFAKDAFSLKRRLMHHWMYWLGLVAGLTGLVVAIRVSLER
jgi:hypothetical protein